ncbi:MAG: thiolase domain-containing protein [Candidatus Ranarchaeia archaeon]
MKGVSIIGAGQTPYGKYPESDIRELFAEATKNALNDANVTAKDVEAAYIGNFQSETFTSQGHIGAYLSDYSGLQNKPVLRVEAACASGGAALRMGIIDILSGLHKTVLVGGVEVMTHKSTPEAIKSLAMAGDNMFESSLGQTFPGFFAMSATKHFDTYGTTEEHLAHSAVKNHRNASFNPKAQFRKEITLEKALNSLMVAYPLKLFDCSPITDGAAALILTRSEDAKKFNDTPIEIIASSLMTISLGLSNRESWTSFESTKLAGQEAYKQANISPKDVDLAEVHDCFTIAEIIATEDLGFFEPGRGGFELAEGSTAYDGKIPINTSGGLKAKGHPVGASGIGQSIEIYNQLRQDVDSNRQVSNPEIGLTHNVGGTAATAAVHIYKRL